VGELAGCLHLWLLSNHSTDTVYRRYHATHAQVVHAVAHLSSSTLQGRLMDQMALTLQSINRIETIRQTSFVPLVYWLASFGTTLLCSGLIFVRSSAPHELVFFLTVISFNLIFLLRLIADLDNPFGYENPNSSENVSLAVLVHARQRIEALRGAAVAGIPHAEATAAAKLEGALWKR
jgi:predicted membrane chloride channel (bestrophin family)